VEPAAGHATGWADPPPHKGTATGPQPVARAGPRASAPVRGPGSAVQICSHPYRASRTARALREGRQRAGKVPHTSFEPAHVHYVICRSPYVIWHSSHRMTTAVMSWGKSVNAPLCFRRARARLDTGPLSSAGGGAACANEYGHGTAIWGV